MTKLWLYLSTAASVALAGVLTLQAGCTTVECGPGTIERDGDCVAADNATDNGLCGAGTILLNGLCVPLAVCDPASTVQVPVGDGTFVCEGQGGGALPACGEPILCPAATGSTTSICGEFYDLESDDLLGAQSGDAIRCNPLAPAGSGPCSYKLEFYDALAFSMGSSTQLAYDPDDLVYDSCGRFKVTGLAPPGSGITAVGARGAITSGIAVRVTGGGTYPLQRLYTVTPETNTKWSQQIGRADIKATGVYVSIHLLPPDSTPAQGVTLNGVGGPAADFYFSDSNPKTRSTVAPAQTSTGANGTAILLDQPPLSAFTSTGGTLPPGCNWNSVSGGNIPGVYLVQRRFPFMGSSTTDVCAP